MTSAPNQASIWVADGPDWTCVMSSTRTPSRALPTKFLQKHRHRNGTPLSSYTARDRGPYLPLGSQSDRPESTGVGTVTTSSTPLGRLRQTSSSARGSAVAASLSAGRPWLCTGDCIPYASCQFDRSDTLCLGQSGCSAWENAVEKRRPVVVQMLGARTCLPSPLGTSIR